MGRIVVVIPVASACFFYFDCSYSRLEPKVEWWYLLIYTTSSGTFKGQGNDQ
jgi:hypothetical protein